MTDASASYTGDILSFLFATTMFNASTANTYDYAGNVTSVLGLASAVILEGSFGGVGDALSGSAVDMYSYRSSTSSLSSLGSLHLSDGGSTDISTAASFDAAASSVISQVSSSASVLDIKIATLGVNLYRRAFFGSAGSSAALASRFDLPSSSGPTLVRSKLTLVEMSLEGSASSLTLSASPSSPVEVTLGATVPFNTSFSSFERTFSCTTDGDVVDLDCPYEARSHTCDFATLGQGGKYHFNFICPHVVPICLSWDKASDAFSTDACAVQPGYASDAVTCECTTLAPLLLSGNVTEPQFTFVVTGAPSVPPTPPPTPRPTHVPTPLPTSSPPTLAVVAGHFHGGCQLHRSR